MSNLRMFMSYLSHVACLSHKIRSRFGMYLCISLRICIVFYQKQPYKGWHKQRGQQFRGSRLKKRSNNIRKNVNVSIIPAIKVTCFINCIRTLSLIKKHCLETICSMSFRISVKPCPWPIEDIRRPIARLSPHIAPECNRSSHSSDFDSVVDRSLFSEPLKCAIIKTKKYICI